MSSAPVLGRRPERSGHIVRELRGRITRGDLAPGVQLPTRIEIAEHFSASSETVQRALEELRRDGFITVRGRQGTFVSIQPPHLHHYGLVFPARRGAGNRFYDALALQAPGLAAGLGRQLTVYHGINRHHETEDYDRLLADVKSHRLAGIIFASTPIDVEGTPVLSEPNIARAAIMSPGGRFGIPAVYTEGGSFWTRVTGELRRLGRQRLAILTPPLGSEKVNEIRAGLSRQGFDVPTKWAQVVPRGQHDAVANLMELLFDNRADRPDCLVIQDDNCAESALAGLSAAGVSIPQDVDVIVHANFPLPSPTTLPIRRLGYDSRQVLQTCFDLLDGQRANQTVPASNAIFAQFEEELPTYNS